MTRLDWALYRWFGDRPLTCHADLPDRRPCPFVASGLFKAIAMKLHQARKHRRGRRPA